MSSIHANQVFEPLRALFDTTGFMPRWNCGHWTQPHGWLHIISDLMIASAYAIIPFSLVGFWWVKRTELAFPRLLWLFSAFIFSCGGTHLVDAIIFYHPIYHFSGVLKLITGIVSWATVIAMLRLAPKAFEMPGVVRLNKELHRQLELNREKEETLQRSNRDLQAFTGIVTHDLKNPVSSALFMAELAREAAVAGDSNQAAAHLDVVLDSIRRMDLLVTSLHAQALARKKAGDDFRVDLNEVVTSAHDQLLPMFTGADAKLHVQPLPVIKGNQVLLVQLFVNLLENALKYRGEKPPLIEIDAVLEDMEQVICVKDNGRGIPEEDLRRIFESEARSANVDQVAGSGIGLALCKKIVEEHHGTITALPGIKTGAVFELRFPSVSKFETSKVALPD